MATTEVTGRTAVDSDSDSRYRISLTDIRGVGEAVHQQLQECGIESVEDAHLLRRRVSPAYNRLKDRGVGKDTLEHLRAVGKAIHYTGTDRVQAKHLTHPDAQSVRGSKYVDITTDSDSDSSDESNTGRQECVDSDSFDPDPDQLSEAIETIRTAFDGGYGEQIRFEAAIARHIHESDRFTASDHGLPVGVIQSLVRYYHPPKTVTAQRDYEPCHGALLVSFGNSL